MTSSSTRRRYIGFNRRSRYGIAPCAAPAAGFRVLRDATARGHDAVALAIEAGDGAAAAAAMAEHLRDARDEVLAVLRGGD